MFYFKKCIFVFTVIIFLLSGCSTKEADTNNNTREVSSEFRSFGNGVGLDVEQDLKESNVSYEDAPIIFQDKVVEELLRNIIGKPKGDVYISELQDIHAIYWRTNSGYYSNLQSPDGCLPHVSGGDGPWETKQPQSLEDLKYCYNLQWLSLGGGIEVPPLGVLSHLPQLETLCFHHATLTEPVLEGLLDFPSLKTLYFSKTNITKNMLDIIGNLPELTDLTIGHYDVYGNGTDWGSVTDGSFLLPLADQLTYLGASGNIDWNPDVLSQMTKLETLSIDYADDVSFLEQLTELKGLSMYCCTPDDWSALGALKNLEHLAICGNMWTNIDIQLEDLKPLTKLDYLEVTFTTINKEHKRDEIIEALPSLTGFRCLLE